MPHTRQATALKGRQLRSWGLGIAAALVLAVVAASYFHPDVVVDLANQVWACL